MRMIEIVVEDRRWLEKEPGLGALAEKCHAEAATFDDRLNGAVALLLADDARLRTLNVQFRKIDKPTNVLSFPSGETAPGFLGDAALGFETCMREAENAGRPLADHAAHLIIHGLLHLIGHDHQTDEDAQKMESLETSILAAMGISDPYRAAAS